MNETKRFKNIILNYDNFTEDDSEKVMNYIKKVLWSPYRVNFLSSALFNKLIIDTFDTISVFPLMLRLKIVSFVLN